MAQIERQCCVFAVQDLLQVDHSMNEYLNHFVAAHSTRASAALCELALVIPRCGAVKSARSFLPAAARMWNLLPSGMSISDTLSSLKNAMNLCLLRAWLDFFLLFVSVAFFLFYNLFGIMVLGSFWFIGVS